MELPVHQQVMSDKKRVGDRLLAGKTLPAGKMLKGAPRSDLLEDVGAVTAGDGGKGSQIPPAGALGPLNKLQEKILKGGPNILKNPGTFVATPKVRDPVGEVIPPLRWSMMPKYAAKWMLDFSGPSTAALNKAARHPSQIQWLVSGIPHVILASFKSRIIELVRIKWKPCWVPLHMVIMRGDQIEKELEIAKGAYEDLSLPNQEALRRDIPQFVERMLGRVSITSETSFDISQIHRYAIITIDDNDVEVVRADFKPTYEHCSALGRSRGLWNDLYRRRIEGGEKLSRHSDSPLLQEFISLSKEAFALTEQP